MKLLFPNGEHAPYDLKDGINRVGAGADADIVLVAPGIGAAHCEIEFTAPDQAMLRPTAAQNTVVVNGKQALAPQAIKPGDLVLFARIGARVVAGEKAPAAAPTVRPVIAANEDDGRTRVRMALPKFVLRGVSGSTFGKHFPLTGTVTIGRNADCTISIPGDEISRQHAKLQVLPDGIAVEDLGSANGTYINDKRVHHGMLMPGDELRLDTVRFLLVAPGLESAASAKPTAPTPAVVPQRSSSGLWIAAGVVLVAAIAAGLWFGGVLR
jgi:pSer/pThr/pTyr-binding forkhead associated (FHA) protein